MISNHVRALAAALAMGTAAFTLACVETAVVAEAATVRPAVGNALKAAIALANEGKGSAALAKVQEAAAVGNLTASEQQAVDQTKAYIAAKTGSGGSGKAKFVNDYNAGRYRDAIADAEQLRGQLTFNDQVVVAQAYYLSGDYSGAVRYLKGLGNSTQVLKLLVSAAFRAGDTDTMRDTLERLVEQTNDPTYWKDLLTSAGNARGMSDRQSFDLYRLKFRTGAMKGADDYSLLAQMALQFGVPGEAQQVEQAGDKAGVLSGEREQRLEALTAKQIAADQANLAKEEAAAAKAQNGDAYLRLGEDYLGYGRNDDALRAIQAGMQKGPSDKDAAQMLLGQTYLALGRRDDALRAFQTAAKSSNANQAMVGRLWALYVRSGGGKK